MSDLITIKTQMAAELKAGRAIIDKYPTGDIPADQIAIAQKHLETFEELKKQRDQLSGFSNADSIKSALADIGLELGLDGEPRSPRTGTLKASQLWGEKVRQVIEERRGGTKAFPGTLNVPSVIAQQPVLIDGEPTRVLDLIPRRPSTASTTYGPGVGNTFSWLKQTVRGLAAGGVPDGAKKPKSSIEFAEVEDRFHVYASLTDPMPKRYLDDYQQLITILRSQLGDGLMESIEDDVLNGSGAITPEVLDANGNVTTQGNDPFRGILNTSGIQAQAYATSVLNTLSAARYKLTTGVNPETPNAWLMNADDVRALEMMTETGTGAFLFGSGRSTLRQVLGDYPIITSSIVAAGSALLGDFTQTELVVREDDHIDLDGSGPLFDRNQVKFRSEGRYGFAVLRPHAFITVDLTA